MMTPRVTNNDINLHDEENNGQEVEAALPPPTEMAVNYPEEPEEPEPTSRRTNRYRFSRSQALAALAAAALVVGTATIISRVASGSGKTSISSSMQMQAAVQPVDVPGYTYLGLGYCVDGVGNEYPVVRWDGVATAADCATNCGCVKDQSLLNPFRGMMYSQPTQSCYCNVDGPMDSAIAGVLTSACNAVSVLDQNYIGAGTMSDTPMSGGFYTCYRFVGGGSKASKTPKAAKRG